MFDLARIAFFVPMGLGGRGKGFSNGCLIHLYHKGGMPFFSSGHGDSPFWIKRAAGTDRMNSRQSVSHFWPVVAFFKSVCGVFYPTRFDVAKKFCLPALFDPVIGKNIP